MVRPFIGRSKEFEKLQGIISSKEPAFVAVYGRRRVGKTYFIRQKLAPWLVFEISGLFNATHEQHLNEFGEALGKFQKAPFPVAPPDNWMVAFKMLIQFLETLAGTDKKAIFFDELPWLNTPKSGFLTALEYFWNSWASRREDILLVVCGSAANWMIKNIVHNKGGLHNRITHQIRMEPFTLAETEAYLIGGGVTLDRYQIVQLFMVMGGIPHYLKEARPGRSAMQIIDEVCFGSSGLLKEEFRPLYESLFSNASVHMQVIKALVKTRKGITRQALLEETGLPNAGSFTRVLEELEQSNFITRYLPFGKVQRNTLYRVTDLFSVFYFQFMEGSKAREEGAWLKKMQSPGFKAWSGFSFEAVAALHIAQIKKALGISGVYAETSSWLNKMPGAQIDLLIDRADHIINVCEMKFLADKFEIQKADAEKMNERIQIFRNASKTKKAIWPVLITPFGCANVTQWPGLFPSLITLDDLFQT
jgi:hypothetical protein